MQIRPIQVSDYDAVNGLLYRAFNETPHGYDGEAELVTALRQEVKYNPQAELVAVMDNQIVGTVLITPLIVDGPRSSTMGAALAPLAVAPEYQQQGVGEALMTEIEKVGRQLGFRFIVILGWPDYYTKFGYQPAEQFNIHAPYDVPTENFMVKALVPDGLKNIDGTVRYLDSFGG